MYHRSSNAARAEAKCVATPLAYAAVGEVIEFAAVVDLPDIGGSRRINAAGVQTYCQTQFEGH